MHLTERAKNDIRELFGFAKKKIIIIKSCLIAITHEDDVCKSSSE